MRTVLIDGDIIVYLTAQEAQQSFEEELSEDEDFIFQKINFAQKNRAISHIEELIIKCKKCTKSTEAVIALSDTGNNFRKTLNPDYKGNRKTPKPLLHKFLREYLVKAGYKVYVRPTLEADDILGILATSEKIVKGDKVIWSMDKDFKTIPCKFHRAGKTTKDTSILITPEMADWNFMYQTLIGDNTDGYKGCKGIGDKRAVKILGEPGEKSLKDMWKLVKETYKSAGMTEEEALLNARMARILRAEDYDFKKKEIKLWQL